MAYIKQSATNTNRQAKADAFINVTITDSNGELHRIRRGIPLDLSNRIERSIINKAKADSEFKITLEGTVYVSPDEETEAEDIPL